ncbi:hypothetical protein GJ688_13795 [Heliobacillus mobilis]|uniref:Uncharacterized protein n=1 Tax=Heliobacterium mobile TaxID=28064 RepID=A0A6I3SM68_HELMO|nr:CBO0543 family protein [Heliobacterium mobile]MTV50044.1 hypothetical protein [Heliobacterium mobile]
MRSLFLINIQNNVETVISLISIVIATVGSYLIARYNLKKYGLLFLISSVVGTLVCYFFVTVGFYSFPFRLFPSLFKFPFFAILTVFSFYVLIGVRFSPTKWAYKIPFYWTIINIGIFIESILETKTNLIKYQWAWDFWDSYTAWWLFFLLFEVIGGKIVPPESRLPIPDEAFRYGKWAWFVFHAVMLSAAIGVGINLGSMLPKQ